MGSSFKITIAGMGDHGALRDYEELLNLEDITEGTVDYHVYQLVKALKEMGCIDLRAMIEHWPGTTYAVVDNHITGRRMGSFNTHFKYHPENEEPETESDADAESKEDDSQE